MNLCDTPQDPFLWYSLISQAVISPSQTTYSIEADQPVYDIDSIRTPIDRKISDLQFSLQGFDDHVRLPFPQKGLHTGSLRIGRDRSSCPQLFCNGRSSAIILLRVLHDMLPLPPESLPLFPPKAFPAGSSLPDRPHPDLSLLPRFDAYLLSL